MLALADRMANRGYMLAGESACICNDPVESHLERLVVAESLFFSAGAVAGISLGLANEAQRYRPLRSIRQVRPR